MIPNNLHILGSSSSVKVFWYSSVSLNSLSITTTMSSNIYNPRGNLIFFLKSVVSFLENHVKIFTFDHLWSYFFFVVMIASARTFLVDQYKCDIAWLLIIVPYMFGEFFHGTTSNFWIDLLYIKTSLLDATNAFLAIVIEKHDNHVELWIISHIRYLSSNF